MPSVVATDDRLVRRLLKQAEREVGAEWARVMEWLRARWPAEKLEQAVAAGDLAQLAADLERACGVFVKVGTSHSIEAADEIAAHIGKTIDQLHAFDAHADRFVTDLRNEEARLVAHYRNEQLTAWRQAIAEGRGDIAATTERLREAFGLSSQQQRWLTSYRDALEQDVQNALDRQLRDRRFDATLENAIADESVLTTAQIDRMCERYAERLARYRGKMIARTEGTRAVHLGIEEAYQQAIDIGDLVADEITRTWVTRNDSHVRDSHDPMDGQTQPFGVPFVSGGGYQLRYPGDASAPAEEIIHCRCYLATRIDYLKRATRKAAELARVAA